MSRGNFDERRECAYKKILLLLFYSIVLSACATPAPIHSFKTARSLKEGSYGVGINWPLLGFSLSRGMTDNFELKLAYEDTIGADLIGKYSFYQTQEGFSIAGVGGVFYRDTGMCDSEDNSNNNSSNDSNRFYHDVTLFSFSCPEEFVKPREHTPFGFYLGPLISFKKGFFEPHFLARYNWLTPEWQYLQFTLGINFWMNKHIAFNLAGYAFIDFLDKESSMVGGPGVSFLWNF